MGYTTVHHYLLNIPEKYDIFQQTFQIETCHGGDPNRLTRRWHHAYLYDRRQIVSSLQRVGFKVLYFFRHGFFPGTLKRRITPPFSTPTLFKLDTVLANLPVLRFLAANFLVITRKDETSPRPLKKASKSNNMLIQITGAEGA